MERAAIRSSVFTLAIAAASLLVAHVTQALGGVPSAAQSTCPEIIFVAVDTTTVFDVIVRDATGTPVTSSVVVVNLSACSMTFCPTQPLGAVFNAGAHTLTKLTDANGVAEFAVCGTLSGSCSSSITADGVPLAAVPAAVFTGGYDRAFIADSVRLVPTGVPNHYNVSYRMVAASRQPGTLNMNTTVDVIVNSTTVDTRAITLSVASIAGQCACGTTCGGPDEYCSSGGVKTEPPSPCPCGITNPFVAPLPLTLSPGDRVTFALRATNGGAPETYSSNNRRILVVAPSVPMLSHLTEVLVMAGLILMGLLFLLITGRVRRMRLEHG